MTPKRFQAIKAKTADQLIWHKDNTAAIIINECITEIERLRTLLRTIATKHNLLKGLSGYPPCSCKTNDKNLCMKHAAADILSMINDELEIE